MNIRKLTITQIKDAFKKGEYSPKELLEEYIKVIKEKDPEYHVFVNKYLDKAHEAIENGNKDSMLYGIPAAIKDNFNWIGTKTTASAKMLENYVSPYNATVTERLLNNGACFVGKTNMDAYAHGSSTETSDFFTTLNPHDKTRVAGGSSGGSAAAVALDMSVYAIGSETAGSVRGPASWCGVVGFAPTFGRFSRYGVVAMGSSLDRPGVFTNSVEDVAILTEILSGLDPKDATSIAEDPLKIVQDLGVDLSGVKIGRPTSYFDERIDSQVLKQVDEVIKALEKAGATIVEMDLMDPKYAMAVYTIIMRSEVSSNLARLDGIRYGYFSDHIAENILDQIAINRGESFGNEAKQRCMTGAYTLSVGYYDAYYKRAQKVRTLIIEDFKKAFEDIDVIIAPTMATTALHVGESAKNPLFGELADLLAEASALAGLPCITLPAGKDDAGLPIGVQFIGPQFKDKRVLDVAFETEKILNLNV